MDILALLDRAKACGLQVEVIHNSPLHIAGDEVKVSGAKTPETVVIVKQLAQHKAAVLQALTAPKPKAEATTTPADDLDVTFFSTFAEASNFWDSIKDDLLPCQCAGNCADCLGLWFDRGVGKFAVRHNLGRLSTESDIPNYIAESFAEYYPGWGDWK